MNTNLSPCKIQQTASPFIYHSKKIYGKGHIGNLFHLFVLVFRINCVYFYLGIQTFIQIGGRQIQRQLIFVLIVYRWDCFVYGDWRINLDLLLDLLKTELIYRWRSVGLYVFFLCIVFIGPHILGITQTIQFELTHFVIFPQDI